MDFDVSNYKTKSIEYLDKHEDNNMFSNSESSKEDNSVLVNQVKNLKQHVNSLQFERDQMERKYKKKVEEDSEVSIFEFNYNVEKLTNFFVGKY